MTRVEDTPAPDDQEQQIARLVHELRAPLTAMLGYADQLVDDLRDQVDALQRLHVMRDNGEHLLQLINGITLRARTGEAAAVRVSWAPEELDPIETVATVTQLLQSCAESRGLSLVARAEPPLPARIPADELRVRQILFNLVGNAIKFTADGGVLVTTSSSGDELRFDVIDTGPGVPEERQAGLFHPFETGDGSRGDGLGLYISSRLAQALGGRLELRASSERGSTFSLILPVGESQHGQVDVGDPRVAALERLQRRGPIGGPLAGLRVLVVEHGPDHQLLLSAVLKRAGSSVAIAGTGLRAIQIWEQAQRAGVPFDLVIVSEHLSRKDGVQVLADLRTRGWSGPVVGTVDGHDRGDRATFESACDEVLAKPIDPAVLRATVLSCLNQSGGAGGRFEL